LNIQRVNNFSRLPGAAFQVATFGSRTGDFATRTGLNLGGGRRLTTVFDAGTLTLQEGATPKVTQPAADFDGDGKADLAIYRPGAGIWAVQRSSDGTTKV